MAPDTSVDPDMSAAPGATAAPDEDGAIDEDEAPDQNLEMALVISLMELFEDNSFDEAWPKALAEIFKGVGQCSSAGGCAAQCIALLHARVRMHASMHEKSAARQPHANMPTPRTSALRQGGLIVHHPGDPAACPPPHANTSFTSEF